MRLCLIRFLTEFEADPAELLKRNTTDVFRHPNDFIPRQNSDRQESKEISESQQF